MFEPALTSELLAPADQFWAAVPLQVQSWIFVPSAVPPPLTSRHLPSARSVDPVRVQLCDAVPLQVYSWIWVPSAVAPLRTSRHLPASPTTGPVPVPPPLVLNVNASRSKSAPVPPAKVR